MAEKIVITKDITTVQDFTSTDKSIGIKGGKLGKADSINDSIIPIDLSTPEPNKKGIFQPTEVGVYPNFGGLEFTQTEFESNIVYFYYSDGVFSKQSKGVLTVDEIDSESTNAVNGKAVSNYTNQTINTIADLRLFNGKEGQIITLLGYYEAGDKEPLNYKWSAEQGVDDGGAVINTENGSWIALFNGIINIRDFGAKCDNSTDDKLAWAQAYTFAYDKDYTVTLESSDVSYSSENIDLYRVRKVQLKGRINLATDKEIIIGSRQNVTTPDEIFINQVVGSGAIRVQGCKNLQIKINRATTLTLWADGNITDISSMAYCKFTIGYINNIIINGQNGGWINSNSFYCNRVRNLTIDSVDLSYRHNGNVFYNPTLESAVVNINFGASNLILNARLEGSNTVTFSSHSWGNTIVRVYSPSRAIYLRTASSSINYTDHGYDNRVISWETLSHINRDFLDINTRSNNYDVNVFRKTANDKFNVLNSGVVFETDIMEVKESFGIEFLTDTNSPFLRARVILYDSDKIQLTEEPPDEYAVVAPGLTWDDTNKWYRNSSAPSDLTFSIGKSTTFKYVKIVIYSSSSTNSFSYLKCRTRRTINDVYSFDMISETKELSSISIPLPLFYPNGTFVKNKGSDLSILGWQFNGTSWDVVPKISVSANTTNISTPDATDLATALTLVNELKSKLNSKLTADRSSGQQAT